MNHLVWPVCLIAVVGIAQPVFAENPTASGELTTLDQRLKSSLKQHGNATQASVWLGVIDRPLFEYQSAEIRPTASSVKTFFLVELFDKYRGQLDLPLPAAAEILQDDHPAISHFEPKVRDEIRRELGAATVRRVGQAMMGKADVSNEVYNAAANLTTAVLGGPEAITAAIHRRDAAFKPVEVRRYMLRDRTQPGDNEATAQSLAALYQRLAAKQLAGIDEPTMTALHEVLLQKKTDPKLGKQYYKGGSLGTDPLTQVRAGWWQTAKGPLIFVVMLEQPGPGKRDRETSEKELSRFAADLTDQVVRVAAKAQATER